MTISGGMVNGALVLWYLGALGVALIFALSLGAWARRIIIRELAPKRPPGEVEEYLKRREARRDAV